MSRVLHTDDRTFSNFQARELVKLCGVNQGYWTLYSMKELMDNGVAALEEHDVSGKVITVKVGDDFIEVGDSGPGIPDWALDVVLDFSKFGGSNRHHKLPTRGAQGNALMTIVGISSVWETEIIIGRRSEPTVEVRVEIDQVRQTVDPVVTVIDEKPSGSFIRLRVPRSKWKRCDQDVLLGTAAQFAWINPHVNFIVIDARTGRGRSWHTTDTLPAMTGNPKCGAVQWFTDDEFADRLAADVRARPDFSYAQWVREFHGSSSVKVTDGRLGALAPSERAALMDFARIQRGLIAHVTDGDGSHNFNPVGLVRLGGSLAEVGADMNAGVEYHSVSGTFSDEDAHNVPFLVEVALCQMPEGSRFAPDPSICLNRTVLYGSPQFKGSLRWREKVRGKWHENVSGDISVLSQAYNINRGKYPCAWAVHVTCPSPGYSGYGKQTFRTDWLGGALSECVEVVTREVRKQMAGESRRKKQKAKPDKTIRDKIFDTLPPVLDEATEGGALPVLIRQLFYAYRKEWYRADDRTLHYGTFCAYVSEYEEYVGHEICHKDPRGILYEPHTGKAVRLGTAEVQAFKPKKWLGHTIIFIEKENLASLLRTMKLGKRWDAIIVGSKGFAVHAVRDVLQKYKQLLGDMVKIICLHDADPAGYLIGYDLATNLPRFGDNVDIQVIDVGLTIKEANAMNLQDEPFTVVKGSKASERSRFVEWSKIRNMRSLTLTNPDGTTRPLLEPEAWEAFMPEMVDHESKPTWVKGEVSGRRVELNAMPPRMFFNWVESKLEEHGCRKVRPPDEMIEERLRTSREGLVNSKLGEIFMRMLGDDARAEVMRRLGVPQYDLDAVLSQRPEQHWSYLVDRAGKTSADEVEEAVISVLQSRAPGLFN